MDLVISLISQACLLVGAFLIFSGGLGVLRFPDLYTRMHAAGVTDTLAATLVLAGLMLHSGWGLHDFKLLLIFLFILITSPTSSHALAKAAIHGGLKPKGSSGDDL